MTTQQDFSAIFQHHTARVDGQSLHYVLGGQGVPLVLLHGFPQTWYCWRHIMPALAQNYTVLALDMPGFGDSSKPVTGYDAQTIAQQLAQLLKQLGVGPVFLVGHDIGTLPTYSYAAAYGTNVLGLVGLEFIIPNAGVEQLTQLTAQQNLWHFAFQMALDIPEMLVEGRERLYISHFFSSFAYNPSVITNEDIEEYTRCFSLPGSKRGAFGHYRAMFTTAEQNKEFMKTKLKMPTFALGGEQSLSTFATTAMQMVAEKVQGGVVEKCGHWIPEEQPEYLTQRLLDFFAQHSK